MKRMVKVIQRSKGPETNMDLLKHLHGCANIIFRGIAFIQHLQIVEDTARFVDNWLCRMIWHVKVGSKTLDEESSFKRIKIVHETTFHKAKDI